MPPTPHPRRRFHRRSVRLKSSDYGPGSIALITFNCQNRKRYFGVNNRGQIEYAKAGSIVVETIRSMPEHHSCLIEASIVMPEHVHVLIILPGANVFGLPQRVFGQPVAGTIPVMINHLKGTATRRIYNEIPALAGVKIWQSGFHDRLIRGSDLSNVVAYINNNPRKHYLKDQRKMASNDRNFEDGKGS